MIRHRIRELTIALPEGWQIADLDDVVEISTPEGVGAGHISTYSRRAEGAVAPTESRTLLDRFLDGKPITEETLKRSDENGMSTASYRTTPPGSEDSLVWHVVVRVEEERAMLSTFCTPQHSPQAPDDETIAHILESVQSCPQGSDDHHC